MVKKKNWVRCHRGSKDVMEMELGRALDKKSEREIGP